jgi:hypothetical protein
VQAGEEVDGGGSMGKSFVDGVKEVVGSQK